MNSSAPSTLEPASTTDRHSSADLAAELSELEQVIDHAAHFLPAQGPITVFIHHNTLHAFEDLTFHEAVVKGSRLFGCQPYLPEDRYRQELAHGRIRVDDLRHVLREDLGDRASEPVMPAGTRLELRLAMLQYPLRTAPDEELRWLVAETDALSRFREETPQALQDHIVEESRHWVMRDFRIGTAVHAQATKHDRALGEALAGLFQRFGTSTIDCWSHDTWVAFVLQALWRICRDGVHGVKSFGPAAARPVRHRDVLREATGEDSDLLVNDVLIRFCAAFLDQGFSHWTLPNRDKGFLQSFCAVYEQPAVPVERWMSGLAAELHRVGSGQLGPLESIRQSLTVFGVDRSEWEDFITATLLALRGWAGMIRQMEVRGDRVAHPAPAGSLTEYLAVRLILERLAVSHVARESMAFDKPLSRLRQAAQAKSPRHDSVSVDQRAFLVFKLAQVLGWLPADLHRFTKSDWSRLVSEIESFSALERRRIFHEAFERRYRNQTLDAISIRASRGAAEHSKPRFQVMCCLDEREESFRRHLEEVAPDVETFGIAGFFNVAMYYRGAADAHFVPLCPIVVRPQHWVAEDVIYTFEDEHRRRAKARRALASASHQFHVRSRSFAGGALLAAGLGALASIPLVARVLFPRAVARLRRTVTRFVQPPEVTQLELERSKSTAGPQDGQIGFTLAEMTNIAERTLRDTGLTSSFARLVVILGHGSSSLNNPHKSAYDCGACGGNAGGPNARALARMMNDPRVREVLKQRGLDVPDDTWFVGGLHNTCNDHVTFSDLDRLPKSHRADFEAFELVLDETLDRNAHERCRRFVSAPLAMSFATARRHVEERSEDLSQARPECGHATNAQCIVARRTRTRGLFLDRRAFLTSYDPTQDDAQHSILTRLLQAAVPVCAGINLEYYFSYVDSTGWGCGTKLPHNVSALLGVMDGAASDLRTGLPWQMVEIHEPVRLLFIVETTPEAMLEIMDRNPGIGRLIRHGWVQMVILDPNSPQMHVFRQGGFEPYQPQSTELPTVPASVDWYRGWRNHLGYALIKK